MDEYRAEEALFEHRFWLQILGDHGRIIRNALSPLETEAVRKAQAFIESFDALLAQARSATEAADLSALNREAYARTIALRTFKLDLLGRHLFGRVKIMLTPTFINHMVNELEEYLRILQALTAGRPVPRFDPLHHDLLWLPDAAGHAGAIAADLDRIEKRLMRKSEEFEKHFECFHVKAIELAGYMRTNVKDFPAFRKFHRDVDLDMRLFVAFLTELEEAELSAEALDRISPLIPDHMMREEWYYLKKLAAGGLVPSPQGDPTKPRAEER